MSYIKISDPSIIDLSAWHQVINVVNQHSDSITAITNNFGSSGTSDWTASDSSHMYDPGSQSIIYGRAKVGATSTNDGHFWYGSVTFANPTTGISGFSAQPIVTGTIDMGTTTNNVATSDPDVVLTIYKIDSSGFKWRLYRATQKANNIAITGSFWINWTAIGPK